MQERVIYEEESFGRSQGLNVLLLLAFSAFVSLWGLASGPGLSDHEAIVAQCARQAREGDGWLIPKFNDFAFARKPPLPVWLTAAASVAVDPDEVQPPVSPLAARLPSALAAIFTTLLVYVVGRSMFGHRIGLVCGGAMSISAGTLFFSHNGQVEMILTLFCTASFAFFWLGTEAGSHRRLYMALFYPSFALAMLAKAPLPLAVVGLPLAVWWFVTVPIARLKDDQKSGTHPGGLVQHIWDQVRGLRRLWLIPGIVVFCAIFLPWPIYVYYKIDHVLDLWRMEFLARYTGELNEGDNPFWYYLPIALLLAAPFSVSLPEAFVSPFRTVYRKHRKGLLFAFTWAAVQIVFLSTSPFKRPHYLVATVPAFALLLGPTLERLFLAARTFSRRQLQLAFVATAVVIPVGAVLGGIFIAGRYPRALRSYVIAGIVVALGATACMLAFLKRQRLLSLAILHLFVGLAFASMWDALGQANALEWKTLAIVNELKAKSIGADDRLTSVRGRPDASLVYYTGRQIQSLYSDFEIAQRRVGRRAIPRELLLEGVARLKERLASHEEEYFILDLESWNKLQETFGVSAREVVRVLGEEPQDEEDDWVLITNLWNTGEEEDIAEVCEKSHTPTAGDTLKAPGEPDDAPSAEDRLR